MAKIKNVTGHHEGGKSDASTFDVLIGSAAGDVEVSGYDDDVVLITIESKDGANVLIEVGLSPEKAETLAAELQKMAASVRGDAVKQKRKAVAAAVKKMKL